MLNKNKEIRMQLELQEGSKTIVNWKAAATINAINSRAHKGLTLSDLAEQLNVNQRSLEVGIRRNMPELVSTFIRSSFYTSKLGRGILIDSLERSKDYVELAFNLGLDDPGDAKRLIKRHHPLIADQYKTKGMMAG